MIIHVAFLVKRSSPASLKNIEYFVDAEDHKSANKKATTQFDHDVSLLAIRFRTTIEDIAKYFYSVELTEVKVII